jgi:FMN phosphatase YigB (HAD superfamily)
MPAATERRACDGPFAFLTRSVLPATVSLPSQSRSLPMDLPEYLDWLDDRQGLRWPQPLPPSPLKATPFLKPLPEVRGVLWSVYGTLLTIDTGKLQHRHPQELRMQIALQKTIEEFKMWHSMSRKPGQPWEYLLQQYVDVLDQQRMAGRKKGDVPEIDSAKLWSKLIERLQRNEYQYDAQHYGDLEHFSEKVAYFFHANLQGVRATEGAAATLRQLTASGVRQGLLDDGQVFTVPQLLRALRVQEPVPMLADVIRPDWICLSHQHGVSKPSPTLFAAAAQMIRRAGLAPEQVLYVTQRLNDDLAAAKPLGFRTALLVGDKQCGQVELADVRQPDRKPDRLITNVAQVREIVAS